MYDYIINSSRFLEQIDMCEICKLFSGILSERINIRMGLIVTKPLFQQLLPEKSQLQPLL